MRVRVRLFAGTREAVGAPAVEVDVPEGARVEDVVAALCARHPRLAPYRAHALLAQDGAFVTGATRVRAGAEIAIMPPVSGGCLPGTPTRPRRHGGHEGFTKLPWGSARRSCLRGGAAHLGGAS